MLAPLGFCQLRLIANEGRWFDSPGGELLHHSSPGLLPRLLSYPLLTMCLLLTKTVVHLTASEFFYHNSPLARCYRFARY